jgi:chromate transporter
MDSPVTHPENTPSPAARPTAGELFMLFCRIGFTSFGGGTSSWMYREMVLTRRWLGEEEFFNIMAVCQALPGMNVTNVAVWLGRKLIGAWGALAAVAGIVVVPSVMIVLIAVAFEQIAHLPLTAIAMSGATAAAISMPMNMGFTMALRVRRTLVPMAVMAGTFIAVGIFRLPLIWVVIIACAASLTNEFRRKDTP